MRTCNEVRVSWSDCPQHRPQKTFSPFRVALGALGLLASINANAVSAYAGAFNGPAGVNGVDQHGIFAANASTFFDNGFQTMYAKASAEAGVLRAFANASNTGGGRQFSTAVAEFNDSFYLYAPSGVNEAIITWVLELGGVCLGTAGSTNGVPNAACGVQLSMNPGSPWELVLDHEGEIATTATVQIVNGFGLNNYFPIASTLQVTGYATNGVFAGDFENTGRIFVYSTTPGVSLATESGHDYSLPVPEPATALLIALGLGCVGGRARKRTADC